MRSLLALLLAMLLAAPVAAQPSALSPALMEKAKAAVDTDKPRLEAMFRDIHRNPELGFRETRTAAIVATDLAALSFEVKTGIGKTGVVGILRNGPGPTVMYRADMDANAVEEATGVPYASTVRVKLPDGSEVPVAHMCGHDAHVTWMLGLARVMVALRDAWHGTLVLVAQPAEEPIAGAAAMVADGLYEKHGVPKPDNLVVLHTIPNAVGTVSLRDGILLAGTDQIDVTFHGVGGHGSTPQLAKDPIVMAAMAVMAYQTIVSRVISPLDAAVLTVGAVQAGTDNNVIPESALLKLNLRYFEPRVRQQMIDAIRAINEGIARSYGMPADRMPTMAMKGHAPPLVNDRTVAARLRGALKPLMGDGNVISHFLPSTGSEDAHLLLGPHTGVPVTYAAVGIADPAAFDKAIKEGKQVPFTNHSPNYNVDIDSIALGAKIAAVMVLELMAR
jgi:amidohydrolase